MHNRTRILVLTLVMELIAIGVVGITLFTLFKTEARLQEHGMTHTTVNQARLLDSLVNIPSGISGADRENIITEAIEKIIQTSYQHFAGYTKTGRMMIVRPNGENIQLLAHEGYGHDLPSMLPYSDPAALAMRKGLSGEQGVIYMTDYKGDEVISAYAPISRLNVAIISQVNLEEISAPFVAAAITAGAASLILIFIGSVFFHKLAYPLVRHLEENELKYRTLFESANEGILGIGDVIEECNDQICRQLGYTKEEIVGNPVENFTPEVQPEGPPSEEVLRRYFSRALGGEPQFFYWHSRHKDGALVDMDVSLKAVKLANRTILLATLLDITDRRRAEIELRQAEKDISEQREQLAHVTRLSTMGEMAAGFAHEVNQPLTAINSYAQGLRRIASVDNPDIEEVSSVSKKVSVQALRAGDIIQRLRDFVNKSDGYQEVVECNELVKTVAKLAEMEARKHERPIELCLSEGLPSIKVDPVQIQQVILNLIKNALEAMEGVASPGSGVVVKTEKGEFGDINITVSDSGSGFSQENILEIFNPFFTTKLKGMGMGLNISQSIILAHDGDLIAENQISGGAIFTVTLPGFREEMIE